MAGSQRLLYRPPSRVMPEWLGGKAVRGRLELQVERGVESRSVLEHRHASGGYHLSKPYWSETSLLVQWINPTAGIFSGDLLESEVKVGQGAALTLTTPSATRIHTRPNADDSPGRQTQIFNVAEGAALEVNPEFLIPQSQSALQQTTSLATTRSSAVMFSELVAPGRVAHGESLKFASLDLKFRLERDGRRLLQDRLTTSQASDHWKLRGKSGDGLHVLTTTIILPGQGLALLGRLRELIVQNVIQSTAGATMPAEDLIVIRATALHAADLRRLLEKVRQIVHQYDSRLGINLRKL